MTNEEQIKYDFENNGMVYFDDFLEQETFDKVSNFWNHESFKTNNHERPHYEKWTGSTFDKNDIHWPDRDEMYKCNLKLSKEVPKLPEVSKIIKENVTPVVEFILQRRVTLLQSHANIYEKNGDSYARAHRDGSDWGVKIGFIVYMNKTNWKYDWGGLLHYLKPPDNEIMTILPKSNRLVIINHGLDMSHWITPTNPFAKEDRKTLIGMFR
jgi:Rps23 Pro-64 3,4-dihydroxylase Tpa1-like proline 4-hydroxylase|tara:strand:- start:937 stop:1569 length:633 start_codon:yes stop_codon:yes gene_type:complete